MADALSHVLPCPDLPQQGAPCGAAAGVEEIHEEYL